LSGATIAGVAVGGVVGAALLGLAGGAVALRARRRRLTLKQASLSKQASRSFDTAAAPAGGRPWNDKRMV
tara:strand:+ start:277 stop:486 length:210 start_codon:yes stop_codon:yes gene_type:complete